MFYHALHTVHTSDAGSRSFKVVVGIQCRYQGHASPRRHFTTTQIRHNYVSVRTPFTHPEGFAGDCVVVDSGDGIFPDPAHTLALLLLFTASGR